MPAWPSHDSGMFMEPAWGYSMILVHVCLMCLLLWLDASVAQTEPWLYMSEATVDWQPHVPFQEHGIRCDL